MASRSTRGDGLCCHHFSENLQICKQRCQITHELLAYNQCPKHSSLDHQDASNSNDTCLGFASTLAGPDTINFQSVLKWHSLTLMAALAAGIPKFMSASRKSSHMALFKTQMADHIGDDKNSRYHINIDASNESLIVPAGTMCSHRV